MRMFSFAFAAIIAAVLLAPVQADARGGRNNERFGVGSAPAKMQKQQRLERQKQFAPVGLPLNQRKKRR